MDVVGQREANGVHVAVRSQLIREQAHVETGEEEVAPFIMTSLGFSGASLNSCINSSTFSIVSMEALLTDSALRTAKMMVTRLECCH